MQSLINPGDFAIYKNAQPYYNVVKILNYSAEIQGTVYANEFRWSTDSLTYSSWIELTAINLQNLKLNPSDDFWIEFRVTLVSGGPVTVGQFDLQLETQTIDKYEGYMPPQFGCSETGNITCITRIQDLCFKPYNVNPAVCLFNDLSYMVNQTFGHDVEYYRAVPNKKAQDISLMEYTLYNVEPSQCVKVLVPDNEFPDNKLNYNPFGIDFENPFEVHIDKQYWEEIFGDATGPQKRDIIYFPLVNRVYEVLSTYLFRAFMEKDSYWKVSLIKYSPKANRYEPVEVRDTLDSLTTDTTELFELEMRENETDITKPQQYNTFIGNRDYDPSRESINKDLKVIEEKFSNYSTLISEFHYSLMNLVNTSQDTVAVQYREPVIFSNDKERSYSAWFSPKDPTAFTPVDTITNMVTLGNTMTVHLSSNRNYPVGSLIKISRIGGITLFGKVKAVISSTKFELQIDPAVLQALNDYNPMWSSLNSFKAERIVPNNFINGYDVNLQRGLKIDIIANRYISVTLNETSHIFALDKDLAKNKWYGIFVNISSKFKQINVNVWERTWQENIPSSPQTTDLFNIFTKTINNIAIPDCTVAEKYNLLASNMLLTNIRFYDKTAELEKQTVMLNQNIVQDASRAIIIDNALPKLQLPFIGQSK